MEWQMTYRADTRAASLADRHYSRQAHGARQFTPPGRVLVLITPDADAVWATSWPFAEYVHRVFPHAWVNSLFRSEGDYRASDLIRNAVAATVWYWGQPSLEGMVTMIDRAKVRPIKVRGHDTWGYCYRRAGFSDAGETKGGLLILQLLPDAMPPAAAPHGVQLALLG